MDNRAPPSPPYATLDLEALAAFNPAMASMALAQLYADGERESALAWALRLPALNPFEQASLREAWLAPAKQATAAAGGFAFPTRSGSLFSLALECFDADAIEALAGRCAADANEAFGTRWSSVASAMREDLALGSPDGFAERMLARLNPPAPQERAGYSAHDSDGERLAQAALKAGRLDWLERLAALEIQATGSPLDLSKTLSDAFERGDEAAVLALRLVGAAPQATWERASSPLVRSSKPAFLALGLEIAHETFHHRARRWRTERERTFSLRGQDDAAELAALVPANTPENVRACLFDDARSTHPAWLGAHLDWGVDPFSCVGMTPAPASVLASAPWRSALPYSVSGDPAQMLAARRRVDDKLAPLLDLMIQARPDRIDEKFDVSDLSSEARDLFPKTRKVDLLALTVAQGFYRCADLLVGAGADWKSAAKQRSAHPAPSQRGDPPDAESVAKAYFEALAVREIALKTSARRHAKAAKQGAPEPIGPPQAPRLRL